MLPFAPKLWVTRVASAFEPAPLCSVCQPGAVQTPNIDDFRLAQVASFEGCSCGDQLAHSEARVKVYGGGPPEQEPPATPKKSKPASPVQSDSIWV